MSRYRFSESRRLMLNHNVHIPFAERDQVARCSRHVVRGAEPKKIPLPPGHPHSQTGAQVCRLTGAAFREIPVHRGSTTWASRRPANCLENRGAF